MCVNKRIPLELWHQKVVGDHRFDPEWLNQPSCHSQLFSNPGAVNKSKYFYKSIQKQIHYSSEWSPLLYQDTKTEHRKCGRFIWKSRKRWPWPRAWWLQHQRWEMWQMRCWWWPSGQVSSVNRWCRWSIEAL